MLRLELRGKRIKSKPQPCRKQSPIFSILFSISRIALSSIVLTALNLFAWMTSHSAFTMADKHPVELQEPNLEEPIKGSVQGDLGPGLTPEEDKRILRRIDL